MFINQKALEKLLKEAYKENVLYIAKTNSDTNEIIYVIAGTAWTIWVGEDWLTKEAKGAIIKLCDDLPETGEAYRIQWGERQQEFDDTYHNMLLDYRTTGLEVRKTRLCLTRNANILQDPEGNIYLVASKILSLVDRYAIDEENNEQEPVGPFISKDKKKTLLAQQCMHINVANNSTTGRRGRVLEISPRNRGDLND